MLLSIVSVALALTAFLTYSILLIIQANLIAEHGEDPDYEEPFIMTADGTNVIRVVDSFKVMFTFCAFVFDLYKWCIFIIATATDISDERDLTKYRQERLRVALISVQTIVITISLVFMTGLLVTPAFTDLNNEFISSQKIYTIVTFSTFLLVYLSVLIILRGRLKKYFPRFYAKESQKILLSNGIIIVSIISRICANIFTFLFQEEINDSYGKGTWFYPLYQLFSSFFASLFPLAAIIVSLMYAVNQKKRIVTVSERISPKQKRKNNISSDSIQSYLEYEE
jgi:hypothetical protein